MRKTQALMDKSTTPTVDAIGQLHIEGNIIPPQWFKRITLSGRPDTIAVILLAEIFYWYRPTIIRDQETGEVKEIRRKFDKERWQCSYQSLADRFGFTKRQATDAVKRLRDRGLITTKLEGFKSPSGVYLSNVLYIEPIPEKIRSITYDATYVTAEVGLRQNVSGVTPEGDTYTQTPTEIPTNSTVSAKPAEPTNKVQFVPKSLIDTEDTGDSKKKKFPPQTPLALYLQENADFRGSKWEGFKTLKQRVEWEELERDRAYDLKSAIDWAIEKGAFSKGIIVERVMTAAKNNKNTPKGVVQPFTGRVYE